MILQLVCIRPIGADLRLEVIQTRHAIIVKSLDPALARILNKDERLRDVSKIVAALVIVAHMEPVQVEAGRTAAGFSATLSPQPQADV